MLIHDALFRDFHGFGVLQYSSSSIEFNMQDTMFEYCSRTDKSGGAVYIQGSTINASIQRCCAYRCETNTAGYSKDFGQFIYIFGTSGKALCEKVVMLFCPESISNFNQHGPITVRGSAQYNIENINASHNTLSLGPCFCGYETSNLIVSRSIAVECHSNTPNAGCFAATALYTQAKETDFTKINFINCSCVSPMTKKEAGTFTYCVFYNCRNYVISFLGTNSNIVGEPTEEFEVIGRCKISQIGTKRHTSQMHCIISLCLILFDKESYVNTESINSSSSEIDIHVSSLR